MLTVSISVTNRLMMITQCDGLMLTNRSADRLLLIINFER